MVRVAIATLLAMALISFIPRTIEVSAADEPPERPMDVIDARPLPQYPNERQYSGSIPGRLDAENLIKH